MYNIQVCAMFWIYLFRCWVAFHLAFIFHTRNHVTQARTYAHLISYVPFLQVREHANHVHWENSAVGNALLIFGALKPFGQMQKH